MHATEQSRNPLFVLTTCVFLSMVFTSAAAAPPTPPATPIPQDAATPTAVATSGEKVSDDNKQKPVIVGGSTYQAPGGEVRFRIDADPNTLQEVHVCLGWKIKGQKDEVASMPKCGAGETGRTLTVRKVEIDQDKPGIVYAVTIPRSLTTPPDNVETVFSYFPVAQLAISTTPSAASTPDFLEVRITSRKVAGFVTVLLLLGAGAMLYRFVICLGVPGPENVSDRPFLIKALSGFSVPLRIISMRAGWASLARFQIFLWTLIVGAGAIYVMMLTGSLLAIGTGTLYLLGIAGAATVFSEVKSAQQTQSTASFAPPEQVTNLALQGRVAPTEFCISWQPPKGGTPPTGYIVQYEDRANQNVWCNRTTVLQGAAVLRDTTFRFVDLAPSKTYKVQVIAINNAGSSPPSSPVLTVKTAPAATPIPAPSVSGLRMDGRETASTLPIAWDAVTAAGTTYIVEYRPHDGGADWTRTESATPKTKATVQYLKPNTAYDIRVTTTAKATAWSEVMTFITGARTPKWSDIITDTDKPAEIDVTRLQMLFFTVITAIFVTLNIYDTNTIPAIDPSYVTLMGISNGVYITAKFVRS